MTLSELLKKIHSLIEANELKRITQSQMADRVGISKRTYVEYLRGTNEPISMKAILGLLEQLPENDLNRVIEAWKNSNASTEEAK